MTTQSKQVLLVDDEERLLQTIAQRLEMLGFVPHTATSGLEAIDVALKHPVDLAIVDLQMPDMNGLVTITKLKEIRPTLKTVLLTGHGNEKVKQATESLNTLYFEKEEMADFWRFIKNLDNEGKVVVIHPGAGGGNTGSSSAPATGTIEIHSRRDYTGAGVRPPVIAKAPSNGLRPRIFGETPAMLELRRSIKRVAPVDCPVIIHGEKGTGRELVAKRIHSLSRHQEQRFLTIDCGNLGNEQFVHQLVGYGRSDLQEAIQSQSGMFSGDPVGTIFFDQVEKMPPAMQAHLAALIDVIDRATAGATDQPHADIRVLAATEADLGQRVAGGRFDSGLYDRLTFFTLSIPPLRDRKDDIPPLCSYFLRQFREEFGKSVDHIAPEVIAILSAYDFPGNVRELAHIIERAVILTDGRTIEKKHLPQRFQRADAESLPRENFLTLSQLERRYILEVLAANDGNKSRTAEVLGISRAALWRKLKQINASPPASA